jgi:hypothetical protein
VNRQARFLMLIQTAALERALKEGDPAHDRAAAALAQVLEIRPGCILKDLNQATFELVEWLMCEQPRPEWVELRGERRRVLRWGVRSTELHGENSG